MRMTADQAYSRFKQLKSQRSVWEAHWQDLADYILPRKNDIITRDVVKGRKKGQLLFDNTAMNSAELLAGSLHSMLTNPATQWFELTTGVDELDDLGEVREYLQKVTKQMHMILNDTNFQTEVHEIYLDLIVFGTGVMLSQEHETGVLHFRTVNLAEVYLAENNRGLIEEVHRCWKWDARQLVQEFAPDLSESPDKIALTERFSKEVADSYINGTTDKFELLHSVYRSDFREDLDQPFLSQYFLMTDAERKTLREGGFRTFPYLCPRWTKVSGETYGRSPGMNALPETKTLNAMTKAVLTGAQRTVNPVVQLPDDGFIKPRSLQPNGIVYYRAGSPDRAVPVFNDTRLDIGVELTRDRQNRVRESFFVDQLQMQLGPQMTATEVNARMEERQRFMGPVVGRQHHEFLRPLIERVFDIMVRRDMLPKPPEALAGTDVSVRYSSTIAKAQRVSEGENLLRAWNAVGSFLQLMPNAADKIDEDKVVSEAWRIYGAPQKVLRTDQEVDAMRDARAQAQQEALQQQAEQQESEQVANMAKSAGSLV